MRSIAGPASSVSGSEQQALAGCMLNAEIVGRGKTQVRRALHKRTAGISSAAYRRNHRRRRCRYDHFKACVLRVRIDARKAFRKNLRVPVDDYDREVRTSAMLRSIKRDKLLCRVRMKSTGRCAQIVLAAGLVVRDDLAMYSWSKYLCTAA